MPDGVVPTPEFNNQLKRTVREALRRIRSKQQTRSRWHKKGSSAAGGGSVTADCSCQCVTNTDIVVSGYDTTARMFVTFRYDVSAVEATNRVVFAAGTYAVDNTGSVPSPTTIWERSVTSADVTVYDNLGADITDDFTISGYIRYEPFQSPKSTLTLSVTATEI